MKLTALPVVEIVGRVTILDLESQAGIVDDETMTYLRRKREEWRSEHDDLLVAVWPDGIEGVLRHALHHGTPDAEHLVRTYRRNFLEMAEPWGTA